MVYSKGK